MFEDYTKEELYAITEEIITKEGESCYMIIEYIAIKKEIWNRIMKEIVSERKEYPLTS